MSLAKHKKALVFFSAGVGDCILLAPLVNQLKKDGFHVTGLFTSPYRCESIFKNTSFFDAIIVKRNKIDLLPYSILHFKKFTKVFLNHFSFSNSNMLFSWMLGNTVFSNFNRPFSLKKKTSIHIIEPKFATHDALQNVFLYNEDLTLNDLNFDLNYKPKNNSKFSLSNNYIIVQINSANNNAPYKNWSHQKWLQLFEYVTEQLPHTQIVILGDNTEIHLNEKLSAIKNKNIISLIGKTDLSDAMEIIYNSKFYMGLDSGLMHMAVALNKPTFTIWGASNPILYGYQWLDKKHHIVSLNLSCAPCSAWINPNTSRVTNPLLCPDFKCLADLSVEKAKEELSIFLNKIC